MCSRFTRRTDEVLADMTTGLGPAHLRALTLSDIEEGGTGTDDNEDAVEEEEKEGDEDDDDDDEDDVEGVGLASSGGSDTVSSFTTISSVFCFLLDEKNRLLTTGASSVGRAVAGRRRDICGALSEQREWMIRRVKDHTRK